MTNGCPNHAGAYQFNGVQDAGVPLSVASCIKQTIPASGYTAPPIAAPLRGVIGYTISGGEEIFGPMDNGFALGQVCTNNRGVCPAGTDTRMCGAFLERVCGTAGLRGNTSASVHMLLSDCGGHAGYHNHEGLSCEYSATALGHSAMVAVMLDGRAVFGQYESTGVKPTDLDACGGHIGPMPATTITNSDGTRTTYSAVSSAAYHYHVQTEAPFFAGCFGPVASIAAAKALYPSCSDSITSTCTCSASSTSCSCADGSSWAACTSLGSYASYKINCPIYAGTASTRRLNSHNQSPPCRHTLTPRDTCIPSPHAALPAQLDRPFLRALHGQLRGLERRHLSERRRDGRPHCWRGRAGCSGGGGGGGCRRDLIE